MNDNLPGEPLARTRGVQLELSSEMTKYLDELKGQTKASTRAEIVRRAVSLYGQLVAAMERGERIEIVHTDGTKSRLMIV